MSAPNLKPRYIKGRRPAERRRNWQKCEGRNNDILAGLGKSFFVYLRGSSIRGTKKKGKRQGGLKAEHPAVRERNAILSGHEEIASHWSLYWKGIIGEKGKFSLLKKGVPQRFSTVLGEAQTGAQLSRGGGPCF